MEKKISLISYIIVIFTVILCYSLFFDFDTYFLSTEESLAKISYDEITNEDVKIINDQIDYYQEYYNVTINLIDDINLNSGSYDIDLVYNNYTVTETLNSLGNYFKVFNQEFFNRFYENNMNGLNIYLANDISSNDDYGNNADIVGLFFVQDNKYIIILDVTSNESVVKIAFHETMHAIEEYLNLNNIYFSNWNSLNYYGFTYPNNYSSNYFGDVLGNNVNRNNIYFVDNYARSSVVEDRARIFEYICLGYDFSGYPRLNEKANYLKNIIFSYLPELSYSKYIG